MENITLSKKPSKYAHVIGKLKRLDDENVGGNEARDAILEPRDEKELVWNETTLNMSIEEVDAMFAAMFHGLTRVAAGKANGNTILSSHFAAGYVLLRQLADQMDAWQSNISALLDAYTRLMTEAMDGEGVTSIHLTSGHSISTFLTPYPKVEDQEKFHQWCIKSGFANMMSLHPSRVASLVKERLEKGEDLPPGTDCYAKPTVRMG
jgi:hypothetical protein